MYIWINLLKRRVVCCVLREQKVSLVRIEQQQLTKWAGLEIFAMILYKLATGRNVKPVATCSSEQNLYT
jgi:hypothetical protein